MERSEAIQEIKSRWTELYPPAKVKGQIVCPLCGHGKSGDGIKVNAAAKNKYSLKCFGCKFSGSVLDLIMKDRGLDFNAATDYAAEQLGLTIDTTWKDRPVSTPSETASKEEPAEEKPLPDYSEYYLQRLKALQESPEAISYLQGRGISKETALKLWLGYDPEADPAGLPGAAPGEPRKHPCPRIIVPFTEYSYMGRAIDPKQEYQKSNSKGTAIAPFRMDELYKFHLYKKPVFVTEGAFDAISVYEAGGRAMAINGVANAPAFVNAIKEKMPEGPLILCMDNDTAGAAAMETIRQGLDQAGALYIAADLNGSCKDINEALQADRETFIQNVKAAEENALEEWRLHNRTDMEMFLDTIQSEAFRPYETGLAFFDKLLNGGMIRQTILLLLAAPGAGKTTLCQQIAEEMARRGKPIVYLNFEMSRPQMIAKAISGRMHRRKGGERMTALDVLQGYRWTPEQRQAVLEEAAAYEKEIMPYLQYNPAGISSDLETIRKYLDQLGQTARENKTEAPAVVVDYLHLISSNQRSEAQEIIKRAVALLKAYAIENNTFAIVISATNRASNTRGQITLESGRDSSTIEYTADYQLSLNYKALDDGTVETTEADKVAELQQEDWRRMILRVNKGRFIQPGRAANLYFFAKGNTFYGENDWMPADPARTPFSTRQEEPRKRY